MLSKTIILRNFLYDIYESPTQINLGEWSNAQQQDFFEMIRTSHGPVFETTPTGCGLCIFRGDPANPAAYEVHFGGLYEYTDKERHSLKISRNMPYPGEMVIAVEKVDVHKVCCVSSRVQDCPLCICKGLCRNLLIRELVGKVFFPDKYGMLNKDRLARGY